MLGLVHPINDVDQTGIHINKDNVDTHGYNRELRRFIWIFGWYLHHMITLIL